MKNLKTTFRTYKKQLALLSVFTAYGAMAQQNGLNDTSGFMELGGNLIRNTNVSLLNGSNKYDLVFNGEGQFGVGNNITAGSIYFYGLSNSKAIFSHTNTAPSTGFNTIRNTMALYYTSGSKVGGNVTGLINDVNTDCTHNLTGNLINVLGDATTLYGANINVSRRVNGGGDAIGVSATSSGATRPFGGIFIGHSGNGLGIGAYATGVYGEATGDNDNYGGRFIADSGAQNRGVYSETRNKARVSSINCAVYGLSDGGGARSNSDVNIGVKGVADFAATSFGVAGYLDNNNYAISHAPAINAGVYGNALYASRFSAPWAGYFDGDVKINGAAYCTANAWTVSDKRLKKEIAPITNSQDIISKLRPKTFLYNKENEFGINVSDRKDYGIIAQELEKVLPELVRETTSPAVKDKNGKTITEEKAYKTVNYTAFFGILIANAQEQQKQLDEQKQKIEQQERLITELQQKTSSSTGLNQNNTEITGFSMNQNEPNPFTHETVIKYTLPQQVTNSYLAVYDLTGKQISTFPLDQKGAGSIFKTHGGSQQIIFSLYITKGCRLGQPFLLSSHSLQCLYDHSFHHIFLYCKKLCAYQPALRNIALIICAVMRAVVNNGIKIAIKPR